MPDYTTFKGVTQIGQSLYNDQLTTNLIGFLDYAFLCIGAFTSVTMSLSGVYGGQPSRLRPVEDPYYSGGQVWEAYRNNWCWEQNIEYTPQPISISGIYINRLFLPTSTSGTYAYQIDYPRGRVTFNNIALPIASSVQLEYSYKTMSVSPADTDWFKQLQFNSLRVDDNQFLLYGSGVWNVLSQNRVQMPAIVVEAIPRRSFVGRQLGGGHYIYQDVLFHIFTETPYERNNLVDILTYQYYKKIYTFDKNAVEASSSWPLNLNGNIINQSMTYPNLINTFQKNALFFYQMSSEEITNTVPGLYEATVRATMELDEPTI